MNLNKAMIIGNLTRDPEVRQTSGGQPVATFTIATNLVWMDGQGQRQDRTEFHNIVAWRKLAEICGRYLKKGSKAYVEGRLQTRDWVGKDGLKRYTTEIVADNLIMLDRPAGAANNAGAGYPAANTNYGSQPTNNEPVIEYNDNGGDFTPDEDEIKVENIPF